MNDPVEELYREDVMNHYQNPRNFGKMTDANARYHDYNPVCGDEVEMQLKIEGEKVRQAMFTGKGCAISQAAASMLTEAVNGRTIKEAAMMGQADMLKLVRINPGPVRIKCVMLALRAMQKGIVEFEANKSK